MERETGLEPATSSLGMWALIENKEHSVYGDYPHLIETTGKTLLPIFCRLTEY
jgi:hypothetical protein